MQSVEEQLYYAVEENDLQKVKLLLFEPYLDINWKNDKNLDKPILFVACEFNLIPILKILLADPRIDLTPADRFGRQILPFACGVSNEKVVKILLADPRIKVENDMDNVPMWIPLISAIRHGSFGVVKLLLLHPRIDLNMTDRYGWNPLLVVASKGDLNLAKWLLACGKPIDVDYKMQVGLYHWNDKTAAEYACVKKFDELADLIERFKKDEWQTVKAIRKEIGITSSFAAKILVLLVLLSDKYLQLHIPLDHQQGRVKRFLMIGEQLPIELQMVISLRYFGYPGTFVSSKDFDIALADFVFD